MKDKERNTPIDSGGQMVKVKIIVSYSVDTLLLNNNYYLKCFKLRDFILLVVQGKQSAL